VVIARAAQGEEAILYAEVELDHTACSHAKKLFFRDRRPELYAAWLSKNPESLLP
jgi:N-carbamoylputrescine amidase